MRWRAALGVVFVTVVVATACGGHNSSTSTTTTLPAPTTTTAPATTTTIGRTVSLGETFSVSVGESVLVRTEGLLLTYKSVVSDSHCRPSQQCISEGAASVAVAVAKEGMPPATLTIGAPGSARYGRYTVTVAQLSFGKSPTVRLKVA
jgi:hypothetical protein